MHISSRGFIFFVVSSSLLIPGCSSWWIGPASNTLETVCTWSVLMSRGDRVSGRGMGISPRKARVSCHTDGVTFFQVYVRLTYFWIS